jgi:glucoamylase
MKLQRAVRVVLVCLMAFLTACQSAPTPMPAPSPVPPTPAVVQTVVSSPTPVPTQLVPPTGSLPATTSALATLPPSAPSATPASIPTVRATSTITPTGVAFGRPQSVDVWTTGDKLGVGTSYTYDRVPRDQAAPSRVWFEITEGAVTDLMYPNVQQDNVRELSLLVAGPKRLQRDLDPNRPLSVTVQYGDAQALAYRVLTADPAGAWQASKEVVTDPLADTLVTRWVFTSTDTTLAPYAYFVPHLGGSGRGDQLLVQDDGALVTFDQDAQVYAVLLSDPPPGKESVGYLRASDGLTDLADGRMDWTFDHLPRSGYGAGTLALPANRPVTLVVGFGDSEASARQAAQTSLKRGYAAVAADYMAGWHRYLARLHAPAAPDSLYWVSAMVLKTHEDKTAHGAGVASLTTPWGNCRTDENPSEEGYRYVWPRDLYHVAMAFIALGDVASARSTLAYLDDVLQAPTGAFPQNASLDGRPRWPSLQMDEVADPILLAWQLDARDRYQSLVKPAADFIMQRGPTTLQDRWEEIGGYVPHTIAAEVAGLVAAADMAEKVGDAASAKAWRAQADEWAGQIEKWTFTTTGKLAGGKYFLRVAPDGQPDAKTEIGIANGGGRHAIQDVVDVSALELVRLGVRPAGADSIVATLPAIDAALEGTTALGSAWHRYTFDAYGEPATGPLKCPNGQGHLWPLFVGERGQYALAAGQVDVARQALATMRRFANPGLMLSEQVWEDSGKSTGSATPLAWAHAEYILLARSLQEGRVLDMPAVVAERYAR